MGSSTEGSGIKNPEPDELVDIQTYSKSKIANCIVVGGSAGARVP